MEPLLDVQMASHRACLVPHKGGTRTHIALQEFGEGVTAVAGRWSATLMASMSLSRPSSKRLEGAGSEGATTSEPAGLGEQASAGQLAQAASGQLAQAAGPPSPPTTEAVGASPKRGPVGACAGPSALHRLTDGYAEYVHPRQQRGRLDFALQVR